MKKPILVVTSHFIKPVEARIESDYDVRRKADGRYGRTRQHRRGLERGTSAFARSSLA